MEIKDVEKKFEEAADNMELRSFSERWEVIKENITIPPQKKKKSIKKWLPAVAAACIVAISGAIIIPIALNNQSSGELFVPDGTISNDGSSTDEDAKEEQVYFEKDVSYVALPASIEEVKQRMDNIGLSMINLNGIAINVAGVHITAEEPIKDIGYYLDYADDIDNPTFALFVEVWNVEPKQWLDGVIESEKKDYIVNETVINYYLKEELDGVYEYVIHARDKEIHYHINYISFDDNIKSFLDEFFK